MRKGCLHGLVVYGLNGSHGTFAYAEEKISLFEAYPDFKNWINGEVVTFGEYADKKMIYKYNYEKSPGRLSGSGIGNNGRADSLILLLR